MPLYGFEHKGHLSLRFASNLQILCILIGCLCTETNDQFQLLKRIAD